MRNTKNSSRESVFQFKRCALSVMLVCMAAVPFAPAHAFEFKSDSGEVTGSFDTTISVGASWRIQGRDPSLVGIANGGTSRSVNEDDGNLSRDKEDVFSAPLKATHELELKYENFGLFARGTYFYDEANANNDSLGSLGQRRLGSKATLLDAYVRGKFDLGESALNVRVGKQVVSWGESTFIQNGINIINPVDVARLRAPGSELKEGLIPSPMVWASAGVTDKLTVEGFYLTNFDKVQIDPRGSFFSNNDFISDDSLRVFTGFGRTPQTVLAAAAPRIADRNPSDYGQYGIALRKLAPELNNSEFGLYYVNYHSRTPLVSAFRTTAVGNPTKASYFSEYPENIRMFGASFSTSGPAGMALQGEYSYRPNQPLQLATPELLIAALGLPAYSQITYPYAAGEEISGYRRVHMHQVQLTATKAFGPTWGAEQFVTVGEIGYNSFDLPGGLSFNGPAVYLPATAAGAAATGKGSRQTEGFLTSSSWGYRLLGRMDFPNAIGPATVSPRIAFSHDVQGVGPNFNQGVKALTLGAGLNYKQNWQADIAYTSFFGGRTYAGTDPIATAGQSSSFASSANPLKDRDFISASVSYSF